MVEMKSWQTTIDSNLELLQRKTGRDAASWAADAREAGVDSPNALGDWLKPQGVSGYSAVAIEWELFGYPDFFLKSAAELYEGQYADRPQLRPITDKLIAWALTAEDVEVQMRKTYVSLQTPRRKFAQLTPTNRTSVDVFLRTDIPGEERLEKIRVRNDPFDRRIRLKSSDDVDAALLNALTIARDESRWSFS